MSSARNILAVALLIAIISTPIATVAAEDAFYRVPLTDLKLTEGKLPDDEEYRSWRSWQRVEAMQPYAVLDDEGEAYLEFQTVRPRWAAPPSVVRSEGALVARAAAGRDVTGSLYLPKADYSGMTRLRFSIPATAALKEGETFYRAKRQHCQELLDRGLPGAAWFRHQARSARKKLNGGNEADRDVDNRPGRGTNDVGNTFDLFSGGRAIRENLQLDRELRLAGKNDEMVDVSSISGITIAEIDWKPLLAEAAAGLDPLARCVPADQHAVFFPSFSAAVALADEMSRRATPFGRLILTRSEDNLVQDRYERQLCLPLSTVARVIGPKMVDSVVLTGSDPYFFTGTDVAVLLETRQAGALKTLLAGQAAAGAAESGAQGTSGQIEGLAWSGFVSPDRRVSCYIAQLDGAVIVTNSTAQLARLAQVRRGATPALVGLDEYKFFRQRYPLGAEGETALVFLSDATIRRWCGPKWRIAASRRLRDAAVMSELQADFLDGLVSGKVEEGPIHTDLPLSGGQLRLGPHGVRSSTDGTLEFQTPIAEMSLDRVTKAEADAYARWRDGYQSNWRWAFDPIALRLSVDDRRLSADLTVMPLIWGSEYRTFVELARGAQLKPTSGDPHEALAHFLLALNRESQQLQAGANLAEGVVRVKLLDWLGDWVSVYVDDDEEYWEGLAKETDPEKAMQYASAHIDRLPVGIHVAVRDALKLTAFMAGVRAWVEQTAPRMTVWESLTYRDEPYVKVAPSERARGEIPPGVGRPNLYYSLSADGLILSLNEDVLKRALDRQIERREAKKEGKDVPGAPWLGSSLCFRFDGKLLASFDAFGGENLRQTLQVRCWGNLPILNEWHRRYPERDSVKLHEDFWHTRLVCPGGGEYVWNDEWQTMESTAYGHPGEPKSGPEHPLRLGGVRAGNFGITFEQKGLRARATLDREGPK